ncbi:MAG: type II toxin-antitoxin system Phd/YefM family antitoxin [Dehalococcoidales bacterium]|nr:type II toxin-antitoxin system Phd/YefM family antitoxin [Dehalococcoidales bacterium]
MTNTPDEKTEEISVTEARYQFLPLLKRINENGTKALVENHKKPVAVILSYREYKKLIKTIR